MDKKKQKSILLKVTVFLFVIYMTSLNYVIDSLIFLHEIFIQSYIYFFLLFY